MPETCSRNDTNATVQYCLCCLLDFWISPNFWAARFWPRFGFKDAAYRLAKKVSPMIAWARDE
jgi:hypothetical protein